eukprot:4827919-Pyramimonas_sp.AAC.1
MGLKAAMTESLEEKKQTARSQLQAADREAALTERAREMTRTVGMESFQFIEKALDKLPRFHQFDMPQLSQETPVGPVMQPHFIAPGPATEGPAKPGTSGNNVPINSELTGIVDDMIFVNYHPFTKAGPARPPTAQPPGG